MTVGSQIPELDSGPFCRPPHKLGSQNTPYKLGLNEAFIKEQQLDGQNSNSDQS